MSLFWIDQERYHKMKKTLCLVLSLAMALSLCACGGSGTSGSSQGGSSSASQGGAASSADASKSSGASSSQGSASSSAVSDDTEVSLTIPARFIDTSATQEELDASAKESGLASITLNEDGSATYVMTKARQTEMTDQIKESIDVIMKSLSDSDEYPSIVSVKAEDDYKKFVVTLNTDEVGSEVPYAVSSFYLSGDLYQAFKGQSEGVTVQYINEATGQEIEGPESNGQQ